jgi:hypothetical protein
VWTGDQMVVWGGRLGLDGYPPDAASYVPTTAIWARLRRGSLVPRAGHSAVWTGDRMIVWGGCCTAELAGLGDGASLIFAPTPPPSPPPGPTTPPPPPFTPARPAEDEGPPLGAVVLAAAGSVAVAALIVAALRGRRRR